LNNYGFTLLELTVVLLVLALIAGTAMLNLSGPVRQARLHDTLDELAAFDELVRSYSIAHHKPSVLEIDLENNTLARNSTENASLSVLRSLPERFKMNAVYTTAKKIEDSNVSIMYSALGFSRSYAVRLEDSANQRVWIYFSGLTGETQTYEKEEDVQAIFATWHARTNAD